MVNVASVPQRSPFRYPGGKTWLVPHARRWLLNLNFRPEVLIEPFSGGAIIGLTVAFEQLADRVILVERDEQVAAVWNTILSEDNEWLARRILSFELTRENVLAELAKRTSSTKQLAFQAILKNRTFHGGIMAPGSSLIKNGENGKGLASRWYPGTLARRIRSITHVRRRISFIQGDGLDVIGKYAERRHATFFIDPPYTAGGKKAGTRLYVHHELNHDELFSAVQQVMGDILMTYDYAEEVLKLAGRYGFDTRPVTMKNTRHTRMTELLIGRDLGWVD
ncbi:MAG: DNA adenine methylase [Candidatus Omnitrophica bacterium]|nr:DNA adenine methylase [Candidatus Omnitrophota bacterium]